MGYYSEVSITMFEDDFREMAQKAFDEKREGVKQLLSYAEIFRSGDNVLTLYWSWIKWYPTYESICFIENYIHNGIKYSFKRIGEENGDVEEESDDPHWEISDITQICQYIETPTVESQLNTAEYLEEIEYEYCDGNNNEITEADLKKVLEEVQLHA